ncbi:putative nucleotidyltransferase substrate binding domain-containing protein [Alicyclobacillus fodiniaquatilis]|uniref:Nucleotidyltransferase substrate binding domain-containing protein n=1 Tax=Alicyclobacillus fodiniaquatilis TaxID=1661150 RepID=A0ABW4JP82_9BACL
MISFPELNFADFAAEDRFARHKIWLHAVIETSQSWFTQGGSLQDWIDAFQIQREQLLRLGWTAYVPEDIRKHVHYIRFGSAARGEDLLGSDLDYALITDGEIETDEATRYLEQFIQGMHGLGFQPCQGFVMGTNPRWIGTEEAWKKRIDQYFSFPNWQHARYLFIMADSRPLYQETTVWANIAENVCAGIRKSSFICWEMAHLGIHKSVAIDLRGQVKTKTVHGHQYFDVKAGLLNPIVHSVRLLALREGVHALPTQDRLHALQSMCVLSEELASNIRSALHFGWRLRLFQHLEDLAKEQPPQDLVCWNTLSEPYRQEANLHVQTAKRLERLVHRTFRK